MAESETMRNHAAFIWSVADLLRGDYKQSEYGKVVLPLTVIRRLDCVFEPTKQAVLEKHKQLAGRIENLEPVLQCSITAGSKPSAIRRRTVRAEQSSSQATATPTSTL